MLGIDKDIQRFMISLPCYFVSEYVSDNLRIQSAQPLIRQEKVRDNLSASAHSINYFIVSYKTLENSQAKGNFNFDFMFARKIIILISIFFGKKVDEHGFIQLAENFWAPDMTDITLNKYFYIGPFNHLPRKDLGDRMARHAGDWNNWDKLIILKSLIDNAMVENEFNRFFFTAGSFYLHSLQSLNENPEIAYIDLIMCGEILSNYPQLSFTDDDLFDDDILDAFKKISTIVGGDKLIKIFKSRILALKRRYTKTTMALLNDYFFQNNSNDLPKIGNINCTYQKLISKISAEKNIKCSYDLRSKYVHSGLAFGRFIIPFSNLISEVQIGKPVVEGYDTDNAKIIENAPTYVGLERVMRFCLLRFIHLYGGIKIDDRLNN